MRPLLLLALTACTRPAHGLAPLSTSGAGTATTTHTPVDAATHAADLQRCEAGDAAGCHAAGLHAFYLPSSPETDAEALASFRRGCDLGYAPACNGLGVLYAQGRGVARDDAEAARLYRSACDDGASTACQHLADALRSGRGVPADPDAADRAEARHACLLQSARCPPLR